jgi:hypothetical protein
MAGTGEVERAQFLESFLKDEGFSVTKVDARDDESHRIRPNLSARLGKSSSRSL